MDGELIVTADNPVLESQVTIKFDETAPGVVIVESGGKRLRVDTATKTISPLADAEPATAPIGGEKSAAAADYRERTEAEPYDYRLINVPTPKRVPRHSLNLNFTHRFQQPLRPIKESDDDLLGLDSTSVSSFGASYGITDRIYFNAYRSPLCSW